MDEFDIVWMSDCYSWRNRWKRFQNKSEKDKKMLQKFDDMEHELKLIRAKAEQAENRLIRWCAKQPKCDPDYYALD